MHTIVVGEYVIKLFTKSSTSIYQPESKKGTLKMTDFDKCLFKIIGWGLGYIAISEALGFRIIWVVPTLLITGLVSLWLFVSLIKDVIRQVLAYRLSVIRLKAKAKHHHYL